MKSEAFAHFTMTYLPMIAFFIFFMIFIGVCFWVFRKESKDFYDKIEKLPLEKESL